MRDMSVASFGSGVRDAVHRLATGCVGNGVERAGYNFHYCIEKAVADGTPAARRRHLGHQMVARLRPVADGANRFGVNDYSPRTRRSRTTVRLACEAPRGPT